MTQDSLNRLAPPLADRLRSWSFLPQMALAEEKTSYPLLLLFEERASLHPLHVLRNALKRAS